ncbi:MAG: hypothetical protein EHM45_05295, partial [Desulfobacteraceae bacterium]
MKPDLHRLRLRLREYLEKRGIAYNAKLKTWRCPNHDDATPSATLYENPDGGVLYCPVCAKSWGIFDIAGIIDGKHDFKDNL